ncbi:hypothetical protein [Chryseobacterium hagamense]|uniref:DUF4468 domain-containing protein n=1 Tax=Chryseobacterium hagamense TaxID=395935 RepID=A0A511YS89_9FLAO|nr:hypothetical protein [Chryseobacterium hagamense]GEN78055.1 hypothetical protein CHA01nite_37950 [Chryseobacterium hagamense]
MKHSKLILTSAIILFSGATISAQKKKPAAAGSGPLEMPADTKTIVIPDEEKFRKMIDQITEAVALKFDDNYKNGDVFLTLGGKRRLMYKAKCNDNNVDRILNARVYHCKVYSLDGKTLLFTYETETAATSLIKILYNSPEKKSFILDFSKIYGSTEYTIGKSEIFEKFPIFDYYSSFNKPQK